MAEQKMKPEPQVELIHHLHVQIDALRPLARRMGSTAKVSGGIILCILLAEPLAEIILERRFDRLAVFAYSVILLFPYLAMALWLSMKQGYIRLEFRELCRSLMSGNREARQLVPPSEIGPLLEVTLAVGGMVPPNERAEIETVAPMLAALLQSIRSDEDVVFTEDQRKRLHEIVAPGGKEYWTTGAGGAGGKKSLIFLKLCSALRPAAISALGVVGNTSSVPVLERFASKTRDQALRTSALQSVKQIREKARFGSEQMLRASSAPQHPDTLLRAASPDTPQNPYPDQLLRAGNSETAPGRQNAGDSWDG